MERELAGLRDEMENLAVCLENLGDELDTEVVAAILRRLADGRTADAIIEEYALVDDGL